MHLLTPPGTAGIAIVRAAADERDAVLAMLRTAGGAPFASRGAAPQRALLRVGERDVDDVLVVARACGALELHLHGSPAVLEALRGRFALAPAAPQAPAAQLLRDALSTAQLDLALEQLATDFATGCARVAALPEPARTRERAAALARSRIATSLAVPQRVVLAGRQNAGKSSLFNALLCRERALTGPLPGLTRDAVTDATALAGYPYELIDTAGEGDVPAAVDAAALMRGRALRDGALVVLAIDAAVGPHQLDRALSERAALVVATKAELAAARWPAEVPRHATVSAHAMPLAELRERIGELLRVHRGLPVAGAVGGFAALSREQLAELAAIPA